MAKKNGVNRQMVAAIEAADGRPLALIIGVGAVGSGIARLLAGSENQYHVVLAARTDVRVNQLAAELAADGMSGRVSTLIMDAANREHLSELSMALTETHTRIAVLVLASGKAILDPSESGLPAFDQNRAANLDTKVRPLQELQGRINAVVVVSSIAAGFDDHDPRLHRQVGYRRAAKELEYAVAEMRGVWMSANPQLSARTVMWRCPLVQGETADYYKAEGIVPADMDVPTAVKAVVQDLLPRLAMCGIF